MTNERGVIIDWLGKTLLLFAILGLIAFEAGAVVVNYFSLDSKADEIALTVAKELDDGHVQPTDAVGLERLARSLTKEADARLLSVEVDQEQQTVRVFVRRVSNTLLLSRFDATRDWTVAESTGQAGTQ